MTVAEAAARLGVTRTSIYHLVRRGRLEKQPADDRSILLVDESVERYLRRRSRNRRTRSAAKQPAERALNDAVRANIAEMAWLTWTYGHADVDLWCTVVKRKVSRSAGERSWDRAKLALRRSGIPHRELHLDNPHGGTGKVAVVVDLNPCELDALFVAMAEAEAPASA